MRTRDGRRHIPDRQWTAFHHPDVVRIVDLLIAHPESALLKLTRRAILGEDPDPLTLERDLGGGFEIPAGLLEAGRECTEAGKRIADEPDLDLRDALRGAVLERLTFKLREPQRTTALKRELELELTQNPRSRPRVWTKPKEVVADTAPVEVYECKFGGNFDQDDLDDLCDVLTSARAENPPLAAHCAVVTLSSERMLGTRKVRGLTITEPVAYASVESVLDMARAAPTRDLRALQQASNRG